MAEALLRARLAERGVGPDRMLGRQLLVDIPLAFGVAALVLAAVRLS